MTHGEFIWCDLSAYEPEKAKGFYHTIFDWNWQPEDGDGMHVALQKAEAVAALYQMPPKFIDMGMPSFWMSYISVENVEEAVKQAELYGGKVEIGPEDFPSGGRFALIRDPIGAGFTVLEGEVGSTSDKSHGARAGHALFVSDVNAIMPFYQALLGWQFGDDTNGTRPVSLSGRTLFHCHEIPDPAIRGKEQYWAVLFAYEGDHNEIEQAGGTVATAIDLPEGPAHLAYDPWGAAFVTLQTKPRGFWSW